MESMHLPPGSGVDKFFTIINEIGLGKNPEDESKMKSMKSIARIVASIFLTPIFITASLYYNAIGAASKMGLVIASHLSGKTLLNHSSEEYLEDTKKHIFYGGYDLGFKLISSMFFKVTSILYGLKPESVEMFNSKAIAYINMPKEVPAS